MWGKRKKQGRNMAPYRYNDWDELSDREQLRRMKRHLRQGQDRDPQVQAARRFWRSLLVLVLLLAGLVVIAYLRQGM